MPPPATISKTTIAFARSLVPESVDKTLIAASASQMERDVMLDLSRVTYAEPLGLLYLTACARTLQKRGHVITLELPEESKVRAIMRRFRFGRALGQVLATDPMELMTANSMRYLGEPVEHYLSSGRDPRVLRVGESRVQELRVMKDPTIERAAAASEMYGADENKEGIRTFLRHHLRSKWTLVEPLMYEALANTAHHPNASRVVSVGRIFSKPAADGQELWLSVWDDGDSIIDTLRRAVKSQPLRVGDYGQHAGWYKLDGATVPGANKKPLGRLFSGNDVPADPDDATLLVASTWPGVTSDPDRKRMPGEVGDSAEDKRPGMGLYLLISFAVEQLGGTVLLRAGTLSANVAVDDSGVDEPANRYRVGIVANPEMGSYFTGNQVVVRIPVNRRP